MNRDALLRRIVAIGREFQRRGMTGHVKLARVYHFAVRNGLTDDCGRLSFDWDPSMVRLWAENLGLEPLRGSTTCTCAAPRTYTDTVFVGGHRTRCDVCGAQWIVEDKW